MRPHRFDPLSFVAGGVFLLYAAVLLLGDIRIHDLRPSVLWIWPVLVFGGLLTLYGARRLWESRDPETVTDDEVTRDEEVS